ncbi:MAG: SDR family NAD(P)-dependent oxidoreductase, partial [Candidatus Rokubacteria bacterium]|nr:SDR family NAD(P)-dependent oxidoreductase [Candidatus Rokubacteria bacterium]
MRSRWDESEAAKLSGLDRLVYASRLIGAETSLVVWGGGNTSIKTLERDHRGREIPVLRVKGSGSDLKSIQQKDFPGVRMDDIRALLPRDDMGDQEMVAYLAHALQEPGGVRPSIETLLHGFLEAPAVIHTHADAIVSLTNNDQARGVIPAVYGKDVIALQYRRPGFKISRDVAAAIAANPQAKALVLERHGTICWGATVREAYEATIELIARAEDAIAERKKGRTLFGGPRVPVLDPDRRREVARAVAPGLRGRLSRARRVIVTLDDTAPVVEFASSADAPGGSQVGPATPDHTIYTKRLPCWVPLDRAADPATVTRAIDEGLATFEREYTQYFEAHKFPGAELLDPLPRVVLVPGLGMFTAGRDRKTAGIVSDIYHHTIDVIGNAMGFGAYVSLSPKDAFDVEYWPLELYKLTLAPPDKELARRIALVTGGASGIGRAVAKKLAAEGAHVVVGDLDEGGARKTAEEITAAVGGGRALGLVMDVTSEASVRAAFDACVLE